MKKALVLVLIAALALTMVAFLPGCGGENDKETAQSLMKTGDEEYSKAVANLDTLNDQQQEIGVSIAQGDLTSVTGEAGEALFKELMDTMDEIETNLMTAKPAYEEILSLEGVQDYKDYAGMMLECIDMFEELLPGVESFVLELQEMIAAAEQGEELDFMAFIESEEVTELFELGDNLNTLETEAETFKKDKNL